jgi:hypothetical protein
LRIVCAGIGGLLVSWGVGFRALRVQGSEAIYDPVVIVLFLISLSSFVIYAAMTRTPLMSVILGFCLVSVTGWQYWIVNSSSSSTAALRLFSVPVVNFIILITGLGVEVVLRLSSALGHGNQERDSE